MVGALLLGLPIAFSLAVAGIVGIYMLGGDWNVIFRILGTTPFSTAAEYVLTTIPMFILMAYFSASGGLARDLYTAGAQWLSRVKGGLAIGKLLIAGVIPGIIVGIFLILAILVWVRVRPAHAPETYAVPRAERWASLRRIWSSLLLIVLVVALLYTGAATPTEVGALGAFLAAAIGIALKRLSWAGALDAIRQTIKTSGLIFMILIGATIFGYYMAMSQIPQHVVAVVADLNLNRWVVMTGIVVAYFVVSMFMDELPLLLLTLQLTFPLIVSMGFDPIWFGVMSMLMVSMGLVFPPVGMIAFVVSSSANVSLVKVYTGTSILMIALVLTTILIMVFPGIVLWLPNTMK